jgi:hypothetical protein
VPDGLNSLNSGQADPASLVDSWDKRRGFIGT